MYLFKLFLFNLSLGIMCAVVAVVYRHILAHMPILNWWFQIGFRFHMRHTEKGQIVIKGWPAIVHKLIWDCEQCQAGQLALWSVVYYTVTVEFYLSYVFGVAWAIMAARILKTFINKQ